MCIGSSSSRFCEADIDIKLDGDSELDGECDSMIDMIYPLPDLPYVQSKFIEYLKSCYTSSPDPIDDFVILSQFRAMLYPICTLDYDIDAVFTTSTGRVIHEEKFENVSLCIDGRTGGVFDNLIYTHFHNTPTQIYSSELNSPWSIVRIPVTAHLDESIAEMIISRHSHTIDYVGRNNVRYSKNCVPSARDFCVHNYFLTYLPTMSMNLNIKQTSYPIPKIYYTEDKIFFSSVLNTCSVCKKRVDRGYICNECGASVHKQTLLDSHGFICKQCGKTLCRSCTYITDFRNYVCKDCARHSSRPYRHVSSSMREKDLARVGTFALVLLLSFIIPISFEAKIVTVGAIIALAFTLFLKAALSRVDQKDDLIGINLRE